MAKILVVEDEETLAEAIAFLLGKEGFEVTVAASGPDAIAQFEKNGADLILLDLIFHFNKRCVRCSVHRCHL